MYVQMGIKEHFKNQVNLKDKFFLTYISNILLKINLTACSHGGNEKLASCKFLLLFHQFLVDFVAELIRLKMTMNSCM